MRGAALVLLGVVLSATSARADFLQDLGFALGKLGDKIEDTFSSDKAPPASTQPEVVINAAPPVINWNPVPDDALWVPEKLVLPKAKPKVSQGYEVSAQIKDDAPQPSAAPIKPVQTIASLSPLAGYVEAPPPVPRAVPIYNPITVPEKPVLPKAKPIKIAATQPIKSANFKLRYGLNGAEIEDSRIAAKTSAPLSNELKIINAVAAHLTQPGFRLRLSADTTARNHNMALSRALLIKQWLESAGVRPTQIDLDVNGSGKSDMVSLVPYKAQ